MTEHVLELRVVKSQFTDPKNKWRLEPGEYIIGRHPSSNIVIPDPFISRRHAKIYHRDGEWVIEDLGSTNGTFVDGEDIREKGAVRVRNGSEIVVGLTVLEARIEEIEENKEEQEGEESRESIEEREVGETEEAEPASD